jgi:hypothetical protein
MGFLARKKHNVNKINEQEGNVGTQNYNLSGFTRVNVRFAMDVEIVKSDTFNVSVSGGDSSIDDINVYLEGDRLIIGYKFNLISFFTAPFSRTHAVISMPVLRELQVTGAARAVIRGFDSNQDFALYVTGASHVEIRDLSAANMTWELSGASHIDGQIKLTGNADIRVSGASKIFIKGSAQDIMVDASGASHIDLKEFAGRNGTIRMNGASRSWINLNGKLDIDLNGASNLEYEGQITMGAVRVNGASNLRRR